MFIKEVIAMLGGHQLFVFVFSGLKRVFLPLFPALKSEVPWRGSFFNADFL